MSVTITRSWGDPGSKITVTFQLEPSEIAAAATECELERLRRRSTDAVTAWLDRNGFPHALASRPELAHVPVQIHKHVLAHRGPAVAENETFESATRDVLVPALRAMCRSDYWRTDHWKRPDDAVTDATFDDLPIDELRELMWRASWRDKYRPKNET